MFGDWTLLQVPLEDVNASSGLLLRAGQDDDFLLQRHCQVFYTGPEPAMNDKLTLNSEPDHSILPIQK